VAQPHRISESATDSGHLGAEVSGTLWEDYINGRVVRSVGYLPSRNEGLEADGRYTIERPLRWADAHITGTPSVRRAGFIMATDNGGEPWLAMALGTGGAEQTLSHISLSALGRAKVGLWGERLHSMTLRDIVVTGALDFGIHLDRCHSTAGAVADLRVIGHLDEKKSPIYFAVAAIRVDGCNSLHGTNWRILHAAGNGLELLGHRGTVNQGDMSVHGLTIEQVRGDGCVVRGHDIPMSLGGQLRVEGAWGRGLVAESARLNIFGAPNIRSGREPLYIDRQSEVTLHGLTYLDQYDTQEVTVYIGPGSRLVGLDHIRVPEGKSLKVVKPWR